MNQTTETPDYLTIYLNALRGLEDHREKIELCLDVAGNSHTFNDLVTSVMHGKFQVFNLGKCCVVMEYITYPQYVVYHCFLAAGDMDAIIASENIFMDIAKATNCRYLSIGGREGWKRALADKGWKPQSHNMVKEVTP